MTQSRYGWSAQDPPDKELKAPDVLAGRLVMVIRTGLALLLGLVGVFMVVLAFVLPRTTTVLVVQFFAVYALLDGLLSIVAAVRAVRRVVLRCFMVLEGLMGVGTAVAAFILISEYGERPPGGLLVLIAMWAIVTGALQLAGTFAVDLQRGRLLLAATAALTVAFGVAVLGWRPPDLMTAVWRLAVYVLLLGALRLVATLWLRGPDHAHLESRRTPA
jgi:uncharacterized membrane protein HdeD (DUF308 family)